MLELKVDQLRLAVEGAAGQEQRLKTIAARAIDRLSEQLGERWGSRGNSGRITGLETLVVPPIRLDLARMTDQQAVSALADALMQALVLKLGI